MKIKSVSPDTITVPEFVDRPYDRVRDDQLRQSISQNSIQQPIVVVEHEGELLLIDGLRRLRISRALSLPKVPVVLSQPEKGEDINAHIKKFRFIINEKRQDLTPSQKADLIVYLKNVYKMNHGQVASFLGIAPDSVTNFLAVRNYIPSIREAVDSGSLGVTAARIFDGLTEDGQKKIWKDHASDLRSMSARDAHKKIRRQYSPDKHPSFYRRPEVISNRMGRKADRRTGKKRPSLSSSEKQRLSNSFELKEIELQDSQTELESLKKQINAAIAPIGAIMRNEKLWAMVPEEMKAELERYSEIYV